jgi:transcription-repair coupling factor (superfamily II helicase)
LRDLKVGDLVVHVDHGIGEFVGLTSLLDTAGRLGQRHGRSFSSCHYAGEDKLFVPVERLDLIQKYTGGRASPTRIASAARRGRRPRRASRRRCATWPRSC